jgi:PEP-CTERM motif
LKFLLLFAIFLTAVSVSRADTYQYKLTGAENVSFELDSSPAFDNVMRIQNVTIHTTSGTEVGYIGFYSSTYGGGIYDSFDGAGFYGYFDQQLYSDTPSGPILLLGVFGGSSNSGSGPFDETITVTDVSTTPEPSSFALLGTGLAAIGCFRRRLRR